MFFKRALKFEGTIVALSKKMIKKWSFLQFQYYQTLNFKFTISMLSDVIL